jgi:ubiquinone/menaquinone biosynthesis C-methylase UbiE
MNTFEAKRTCPVELAGSLDNSLRRFFQNPEKILAPFIKEGMKVLDMGCGPGYFTIELAKMVGSTGKVIAADLQEGMLNIMKRKIIGTESENRIEMHKCEETKIGISQKVDFVLCFWMVHEVSDKDNLFRELKSILKPEGKIFIIEPRFHVTKGSFDKMINIVEKSGFRVLEKPKVFFSRAVLLKNEVQEI